MLHIQASKHNQNGSSGNVESFLSQQSEAVSEPALHCSNQALLRQGVGQVGVLSLRPSQTPVLRRKCACGGSAGPLSGECEECKKKKEDALQRKEVGGQASGNVPPNVREVVNSPGQPLGKEPRAFMEPRFGHDFGQVRIHTGSKAEESARSVNSLAYTVGKAIVFGQGQYSPETSAGKMLLAHELAHVVQQNSSEPIAQQGNGFSEEVAEQEAEQSARSVVGGQAVSLLTGTPRQIARQKDAPGATKTLSANPNWSYVVYAKEIKLRYYDKGPEGKPDVTIGTIPWVSNNPGNMGVNPNVTPAPVSPNIPEKCKSQDKDKQVGPDSQQALPLKLGAVGLYACRYAIFPSLDAGMKAILPYLRGFAENSTPKNPNMTVEMALRNFKGLEPKEKAKMEEQRKTGEPVVDVRDTYVNDIKNFMFNTMKAAESMEIGSAPEDLDVAELKAITQDIQQRIKALMAKKIMDVTDADTDMQYALKGLMKSEGIKAPPGVTFTCDGFSSGDLKSYDGNQKRIIEALKTSDSAKAELSAALACK